MARGRVKVVGLGRRGKDAAPHSDKDQGCAQMAAEERRSKNTAHLRPPRTAASRCASHFLFSFLGCCKKRPARGETANNGRKKYFSHFEGKETNS